MNVQNRSALCPHAIGIIIFLFMATACAITTPQRSAITEFGEATALFAQLATSELHQMRDAVVAMNVSRLVLEGTAANPDLTNLDEQFDPEVVKARVEAAQVLHTYGRMLVALSMGTQEADIQRAADSFLSSVKKLPISSIGITQNQTGALGEVVEGIGQKVLDVKRRKAILRLVGKTRDVIPNLCDLFIQEFDPSSGKLATQYLNTTERLLPIAKIEFYDGHTVSHRAAALAAYQLAMKYRERRSAVIQPISQAARDLKERHEDLLNALNEKSSTVDRLKAVGNEVKDYKWTLKALGDAAKQLDLSLLRRVGL